MTKHLMDLADAYGNHRMTDGHHDLAEDHPHTLKARAALLAAVEAQAAELEALTNNLRNATNILQSYIKGTTSTFMAQEAVNAFNAFLDERTKYD